MIRLSGVVKESSVDGPGLRYVVFTQGCTHNCSGCHNPETHCLTSGYLADPLDILREIKSNPLLSGVTISGGDPMVQPDVIRDLIILLKREDLHVMLYTGFTLQELLSSKNKSVLDILNLIDILVDGRFDDSKKSHELVFKGSANQRVIDMSEWRTSGEIHEVDYSIY